MLKKVSAYFFILIASLVLLVHAVFPHHHHYSQICFETTSCQNNENQNCHSCMGGCHHPDGSGTENCVLKQTVVLPPNQSRLEIESENRIDYQNQNDYFNLEKTGTISFIPVLFTVNRIPVFPNSHSEYISTSTGLRAPPAV
jgi:hypothetical protein